MDLVQVKAHDIQAFAASKAFYGGVIGEPDHARLSLESSQHIYKFLPKRPYLVKQQYVSGTRGGGTTSPRSFPSDQLSSERKRGGGGGGGTSATTKSSGV